MNHKKHLESRMLGNLHVRFGVGAGVELPGLQHDEVSDTLANVATVDASLERYDPGISQIRFDVMHCGVRSRSIVMRAAIKRGALWGYHPIPFNEN